MIEIFASQCSFIYVYYQKISNSKAQVSNRFEIIDYSSRNCKKIFLIIDFKLRRTALEFFYYFCVFLSFVLQNELNMMNSGDEDDEFCSVNRLGSIDPNFLQKNSKIIKKFIIELVRLSLIRFDPKYA